MYRETQTYTETYTRVCLSAVVLSYPPPPPSHFFLFWSERQSFKAFSSFLLASSSPDSAAVTLFCHVIRTKMIFLVPPLWLISRAAQGGRRWSFRAGAPLISASNMEPRLKVCTGDWFRHLFPLPAAPPWLFTRHMYVRILWTTPALARG